MITILGEFNEFRSLQPNCTKYLFRTLSVSSSSSSPSLSSREEGRVLSCDVLVVTTRLQSLWKNMKTSVRAPNCHLLNYDCFQDKEDKRNCHKLKPISAVSKLNSIVSLLVKLLNQFMEHQAFFYSPSLGQCIFLLRLFFCTDLKDF